MRTPPDGLADDALVGLVDEAWGIEVDSIEYRAVGFGSHHWAATDRGGVGWFVTVDELDRKRRSIDEPRAAAFARLEAALATAKDLRDGGAGFVVAPVPARDGAPLVRMDDRFAVALFPYVDGQSYSWDDVSLPQHRLALLELIVALHGVSTAVTPHARTDDFDVAHRDELEQSIANVGAIPERGPYAGRAATLLRARAPGIRTRLDRYDDLVASARRAPSRIVVTHGEPHPGNTMRTADGWVLIDWDTTLLAPPERDLWSLDPGDGSVLDRYAAATGTTPEPRLLELFRLRWDLADTADYVSRFRSEHSENEDEAKSWDNLCALIARLAG